MRYSQQVDEQYRESRVSVDSPCYVSGLCLHVHMNALTHTVWGAFVAAWVGWNSREI